MKIYVETERLILREILPTDIEGMFKLDSDPEVHAYLGNNPVTQKNQIVDVIHFIRKQYLDNGIGRWAVIDKKTNEFLGWAGLKLITEPINGHNNFYDLGYRFRKEFWGKGIATESAIALLKYAFSVLETKKLFAFVDCQNLGSNKILNKIGMQFIEKFNYEGIEHNWFEIQKADFEKYNFENPIKENRNE